MELPFLGDEHDQLIEHGDAEPGDVTPDSSGVSHGVHGPSDVTAVLELFDRRYRDLRGDDEPYSSQDPAEPTSAMPADEPRQPLRITRRITGRALRSAALSTIASSSSRSSSAACTTTTSGSTPCPAREMTSPYLVGLAGEPLGRAEREHDLAAGQRLEVALDVGHPVLRPRRRRRRRWAADRTRAVARAGHPGAVG